MTNLILFAILGSVVVVEIIVVVVCIKRTWQDYKEGSLGRDDIFPAVVTYFTCFCCIASCVLGLMRIVPTL